MKRILLTLLFGAWASTAWAQGSDAFATEINNIFTHVNRNPVTTGLLLDYGIEFTNVGKFKGVPSDTNQVSPAEWRNLYKSLYSMRFNNNTSIAHPSEINSRFEQYPRLWSNTTGLALLHFNYERFRDDAISSNLVYVSNNRIYDTPGRSSSPYKKEEVFAITPLDQMLSGGNQRFVLPNNLFFTNTGKTLQYAEADLADGAGWRQLTLNQPINANYTTEGEKLLRIKIRFTDGTIRECHSKVWVKDIKPVAKANTRYFGSVIDTLDFPLAGFKAPKAYLGQIAGARVTVEYANNDRVLDRPLIVVEGFDAWHILHPNDPERNFSFNDFITGRGPGEILVAINKDRNGQTLNDALDERGWDLVFVDFKNGTDHIQRNAYLVQNIIEWVNQQKAKTANPQPNVVVGMSMGGLIARYALRTMEIEGVPHHTRLYVSHDSPHQGANVPLGVQAMVSDLWGKEICFGLPGIYYCPSSTSAQGQAPELDKAYRLLQQPAARQMLKYQVVRSSIGSMSIDNSAHDNFMQEYRKLGYPTQTKRNIAISNGSECAVPQGFGPYAELITLNGSINLSYWENLLLWLVGSLTNQPLVGILVLQHLNSRTLLQGRIS